MALTERQSRFVQHFLASGNATQAAIQAGYAESGASVEGARLLANAKIRAAVEDGRKQLSERLLIDREWVLRGLVENFSRAMQHSPVRDKDGNETGEYRYEGSVANKAAELIGKLVGAFPSDKLEVTGKDGGPIQTEAVNMAEFRALPLVEKIRRLRERIGAGRN